MRDAEAGFYDPLIWTAGKIGEEYDVSVSDVMGLLLKVDKDESTVRKALDEARASVEAQEARKAGRIYDLVAHARRLLE